MFILRCTFWLSVMYASLTFGVGALRTPHAFEAAVAGEAATLSSAAVARATDWCVEQPGRCAHDAAALDALVESVASTPRSESDLLGAAPMPASNPRRQHAPLTAAR